MSAPEIIYLIPGEYEGEKCLVWCDDPAPSSYSDPDDAVKYVRADTLPLPVLPPFPPEGEGMPRYGLQWNGPESPVTVLMDDGFWTPWHLANTENERLQARVANLTSALKEAAEFYESEFGAGLPDTWQKALDGQCGEPDMCWDYEGRINHFGDLNTVAHDFADGIDPNSSGVARVRCARQMPDRWLQVTLMDDGVDSQEVKWEWVEQPKEQAQ